MKRQSVIVKEAIGGQSYSKPTVEDIPEQVPCEDDSVDQGLGAHNPQALEVGRQIAVRSMVNFVMSFLGTTIECL